MSDERVREILKRGDPGGDDARIAPSDLARMRRAILAHAPVRRRPWALVLVPASVAAALVVAVLWLASTKTGDRAGGAATAGPVARSSTDARRPEAASLPTAAPVPVAKVAPRVEPRTRLRSPRTIRFVTQSGTQIIWTLDPDLEI